MFNNKSVRFYVVRNVYFSLFSSFKTSKYPAVIIPEGKAIIATPTNAERIVNHLPTSDTGVISPYPTLVNDIAAPVNRIKKIDKCIRFNIEHDECSKYYIEYRD